MSEQITTPYEPGLNPEFDMPDGGVDIPVRPKGSYILGDIRKEYGEYAYGDHLLNAEQEVELAKTIEAGQVATILLGLNSKGADERAAAVTLLTDSFESKANSKYTTAGANEVKTKRAQQKLLGRFQQMADQFNTPEQKLELDQLSREGSEAKRILIGANRRLVMSRAKVYVRRDEHLKFSDLEQEGTLGLIRAVEKYDINKINPETNRPYKFSTYAMTWINQAIIKAIDEQNSTIELPRGRANLLNRVLKRQSELKDELGRNPSPDELSAKTGKTAEQLKTILETHHQFTSLNLRVNEEGTELGDFIENESPEPFAEVEMDDRQQEQKRQETEVDNLLTKLLSPREKIVIDSLCGLSGSPTLTNEEICKKLGIRTSGGQSAAEVNESKISAMTKLRESSELAVMLKEIL